MGVYRGKSFLLVLCLAIETLDRPLLTAAIELVNTCKVSGSSFWAQVIVFDNGRF
jgi:hypothetical protein